MPTEGIPGTPVPAKQWAEEFSELLGVYRRLRPKRVLEIGTWHGGTLYHWLRNGMYGCHVVSVDRYEYEGADSRDQYDKWCAPSVTVEAIAGDSTHKGIIAAVRRRGPYGFVFIDGSHDFPSVARDFLNYREMVEPGGVLVLHDIVGPTNWSPENGVDRLWACIRRRPYDTWEIVADKEAAWGGYGLVKL